MTVVGSTLNETGLLADVANLKKIVKYVIGSLDLRLLNEIYLKEIPVAMRGWYRERGSEGERFDV